MPQIKWRRYEKLPRATGPLVIGVDPSKLKTGQKGDIRFIASGPINNDGLFNVSLWNQKTNKHYSEIMTRDKLTEQYKNDGIEPIWVDDNFKFGEINAST